MTQTGIHREAHHEESTVKRTADITLVENSTRGKKPKIFPAQTVEITDVDDTVCRDCLSIGGQAATATCGWVSFAGTNLCPNSEPKVPL